MDNLIKYICVGAFAIFSTSSHAQIKRYKGDKEFENYNYAYAIDYYKKIVERKGEDYHLVKRLADSYRMIGNSEESEKWYAKSLKYAESDASNIYFYAEALRSNGNYLEARKHFLLYGINKPEERKRAEALAKLCEVSLEWMANSSQIKVDNVQSLNTEYNEFSPAIINNKIYFSTDRLVKKEEYGKKDLYGWTGNSYLFIQTALVDSFQEIKIHNRINELNNSFHNGTIAFSKNGDTMYFTRTSKVVNPKKVVGKEKAGDFVNRLEIYFAVYHGGKWGNIQPFPYNDKLNYSVGHPALSPDGSIIYFASDMPGSIGGTDLFYSERNKDGSWSKPKNLGHKINSPAKELFPFIANDGVLYFSSDGHEGMGGLDIFYAKGQKSEWLSMENMKYPVNSPKDDFGIVFVSTGESGFFSSNREGGLGGDDIYSFRKPACVLAGITLESVEGKEIPLQGVSLALFRKGDTSSVIAFEGSVSETSKKVCLRSYYPCATVHNAEGTFYFSLQPGLYELKASKNGYFTHLTTIDANCTNHDTVKIALSLNKIILNKPVLLKDLYYNNEQMYVRRNIYYDLDRAEIRYDAAIELDKVVEVLKENPDIRVELSSHTDSRHTTEYNFNLSQKRAESAVKYIISKGIDQSRIVAKGYGESVLKNHCKDGVECSEDLHQQNRRTEIKVIEILQPEVHLVEPYDTLFSISQKYNISIEDLKNLNNIQNDIIYTGDRLKLK